MVNLEVLHLRPFCRFSDKFLKNHKSLHILSARNQTFISAFSSGPKPLDFPKLGCSSELCVIMEIFFR